MKIHKLTRGRGYFPELIKEIPDSPKHLFCLADDIEGLLSKICLGVVGSRKVSPYGRNITELLAGDIARAGVVIVSGLALGVDALAHQAALNARGKTIAVMPCGLDRIYPSTNHALARKILENGGALISEYPSGTDARREHFIARNRLVSGLSKGVLITEAAVKSGTLHTANFALEQGREVMAVPGNILSPLSAGTNNLIKAGATPVTEAQDVLRALGFEKVKAEQQELLADNEEELTILQLLRQGITDGDLILQTSQLEPAVFNQTLTMLEITGRIKASGAGQWTLS